MWRRTDWGGGSDGILVSLLGVGLVWAVFVAGFVLHRLGLLVPLEPAALLCLAFPLGAGLGTATRASRSRTPDPGPRVPEPRVPEPCPTGTEDPGNGLGGVRHSRAALDGLGRPDAQGHVA